MQQIHAIQALPRPRIRRAARTQAADPAVRSERRYNPHIATTDTSWPLAECVVFYSRDLRRVHSVWIVPGTTDMESE